MIYLPSGYGGWNMLRNNSHRWGRRKQNHFLRQLPQCILRGRIDPPTGRASPMNSETAPSEWSVDMYSKKLTLCDGASRLCQTARSLRDATIRYAASTTVDACLQGGEFPRDNPPFGLCRDDQSKGLTEARHDDGVRLSLPQHMP